MAEFRRYEHCLLYKGLCKGKCDMGNSRRDLRRDKSRFRQSRVPWKESVAFRVARKMVQVNNSTAYFAGFPCNFSGQSLTISSCGLAMCSVAAAWNSVNSVTILASEGLSGSPSTQSSCETCKFISTLWWTWVNGDTTGQPNPTHHLH